MEEGGGSVVSRRVERERSVVVRRKKRLNGKFEAKYNILQFGIVCVSTLR